MSDRQSDRPEAAATLVTRGDLARQLKAQPQEISYLLNQHADIIRPIGKAGVARLYSAEVVELVRAELQKLRTKRRAQCRSSVGKKGNNNGLC